MSSLYLLMELCLIFFVINSFPKISKDTLKETVNAVAIRVGQKEVDKRWTCK
jgi:chromatin assembly factor 1 subunit A